MANHNQGPFVHIDDATAANARRRGQDPQELERCTKVALHYLYTSLPKTPVDADIFFSALPGRDPSGDDRISALPFAILRNIVSCLPAKDAARTAVLSSRWRPVWRCTPLAFADAHLVAGFLDGSREPVRAYTPGLVATVSRVLAAHPGPFRGVHIVCCYMDAHQQQLARWVRTLVDKGVQELVLVNRPWPLAVPLPAALLRGATLTNLYLGFWKFPDTSALPRCAGPAFPNLCELFLGSMEIENRDMDFLLNASPALEKVGVLGCRNKGLRLRLAGQRLRCVQICTSVVESIAVMNTPSLERLIIWGSTTDSGSCIRVKIGNAPKLRVLGYLEPGVHMLEIRNTVIHPGISASPSTLASNVNILGLDVRFGVRNDVKMLPTFLKCFPNVETLHIMSHKTQETTGKVNLKFWQEVGPIESIRSSIKAMTFREFRGERSETAFLKFLFQNAQVLKKATIMASMGYFTSIPDAISKVQALKPDNWGNNCSVVVCESSCPDGGELWCFRAGFELSVSDPFAYH